MEQVRIFSRRLQAKHVLYLIDSCYAGLGLTRSGTIPPSERDYLRKITTRKAHQMLTVGGRGTPRVIARTTAGADVQTGGCRRRMNWRGCGQVALIKIK
jgi:hypothetical protein